MHCLNQLATFYAKPHAINQNFRWVDSIMHIFSLLTRTDDGLMDRYRKRKRRI